MSDRNIILPVTGMTCANCALNIQRNLKKVKGVKDANVNFATKLDTIVLDKTGTITMGKPSKRFCSNTFATVPPEVRG